MGTDSPWYLHVDRSKKPRQVNPHLFPRPTQSSRRSLVPRPSLFSSPLQICGYFLWKPNDSLAYKTFTKVPSKKEIVDQIQVDDMPPALVDLPSINRQLPKNFAHAPDQTYRNKYPYKMTNIDPLYVAKNVSMKISRGTTES
jgi:hypothetical protein